MDDFTIFLHQRDAETHKIFLVKISHTEVSDQGEIVYPDVYESIIDGCACNRHELIDGSTERATVTSERDCISCMHGVNESIDGMYPGV